MKKVISLVLIAIMTLCSTAYAEYSVNYAGDLVKFRGKFIASDDNTDDYSGLNYGCFYEDTYYDTFGNAIPNYSNYEISTINGINDYSHSYSEVMWLKPRHSLITKKDLICSLYTLINLSISGIPYPLGDSNKFADIDKYPDYKRAIEFLCASDQYGYCILNGTERDGNLYLDLDSYVTKAEMAKMLVCYSIMYGPFFDKVNGTTWNDISGHWAEVYIKKLNTLDWCYVPQDRNFDPNGYCSFDYLVETFHRIMCNELNFDLNNTFALWSHVSDFIRVTKIRTIMGK